MTADTDETGDAERNSANIPQYEIPHYRELTTEQAEAIIDVWGNQAIDTDRGPSGTATVSTPPMSVQQIAIIVLRAAKAGAPVGSYTYRCAKLDHYDPDREHILDGIDAAKYCELMKELQQIVREDTQ